MRKLLCVVVLLTGLALPPLAAEADKAANSPKRTPELAPIAVARSGSDAKLAWDRRRRELEQRWLKVLGGLPTNKPPLEARTLEREELPDFMREHVQYQVEAGLFSDGYLLKPKEAHGELPGLVVFHATTEFGARGAAGLEPAYPEEKWHGVQFVRRGYVVWCPRNFINTPGTNYAGNAEKLLTQHPEWTGMGRMTWDAIRAMDFLQSCPGVDRRRIGCFGHSLGAKEVLYAMAFDERYRAGVFSEGGVGLAFSNWEAPWYLGTRRPMPGSGFEHHQLIALIAPRPFLLIAGDSADDERSELFVSAARPVYELYGADKEVQFLDHHQGHVYSSEARPAAEAFLDRHLKQTL